MTIPASVKSIGEGGTFQKCTSLKSVQWNATTCTIDDSRDSYKPYYPPFQNLSSITKFTFGSNVQSIPEALCSGISGLTSITIPANVTSIGYKTFYECSSLKSVIIQEGVTSIGSWAFSGCKSLTDITIPESVKSIGGYAFSGCEALKSVTIQEGVTSIGYDAFYECSSLQSVTIPSSVTSIEDKAFSGCSSLTSLTIPSSVIAVGSNTFNSLPALESVVICSAAKDMIFFQCPSLTHITWNVKSGVDSQKPFNEIKNQILSFTIGEDVEYIPANICNGMINLESIVIPTNIKQIGSHAFANCNKLTLVTWNATNSKIGDAIFQNTASKIKCFNFGESVNIIPDFLCDGMSNLTSITIPKDVKVIGKNVFRYCRNLTSVIWNAENCEPTMWGEYQNDWYKNKDLENNYYILDSGKQDWYMYGPFSNISHKITSFKIGNNVQQIPSCLCFGMSKARITFHQNIQSIGKYALWFWFWWYFGLCRKNTTTRCWRYLN